MNEQEVKAFIGEDRWEEFCEWMTGQTVGVNTDGSIDYYDSDVERFKGDKYKELRSESEPEGRYE